MEMYLQILIRNANESLIIEHLYISWLRASSFDICTEVWLRLLKADQITYSKSMSEPFYSSLSLMFLKYSLRFLKTRSIAL